LPASTSTYAGYSRARSQPLQPEHRPGHRPAGRADRSFTGRAGAGRTELLDGDRALGAELGLLHTPGHTPGSQSLLVRSGGDALLCWGDVANHPAQVGRPDWGPASDVQPELAAATRRRLLDEVESGRGWLAPAHFPEPFGTVERAEGARRWAGRR
jgi:glyoxylase-like metal-dependent hydrolase (beta-lactamase superfamily II)